MQRRWEHLDEMGPAHDVIGDSCRFFCSVPGLSSLFKELRCGVSFWLCNLGPVHLLIKVWFFDGRVREVDRLGNNAADEAADFGRRRVGPAVIDARP